ncbi:uncharacterized protein LOC141881413 isoform X2 [Acropora palmata]|uniref:uncharacterized protein LOC141881413 isoform X2 n=1 Tax=Acropora palmata TaxID=6131 RepID=UPI003DA138D9
MKERKETHARSKRLMKSQVRRRSVVKDIAYRRPKNGEQDISEITSSYVETKEFAKDKLPSLAVSSLMTNNRALAVALEDAQLELRSVNLENTQLRKQIHDIHHQFVEKTGDLEKQIKSLEKYSEPAQVVFGDVNNLVKEACAKFLQGSNFLSDALYQVNSFLTISNGVGKVKGDGTLDSSDSLFNKVSFEDPVVSAACTTPPPDEPSSMEITLTFNDVITADSALMPLHKEQGKFNNDPAAMEIDQSQDVNKRRSKRKSSLRVCYAEPSLNSKLRRGDPFTDSTLCGGTFFREPCKKRKEKSKRQSSLLPLGCKKKRVPLSNLTNIIKEEPGF